jgi:glycosyltransferase involved in cell wall biosynthesis
VAPRVCAIIPTRNHWQRLDGILAALRAARLPVFIVDDGSNPEAAAAIAALDDQASAIRVHRRADAPGKGRAMRDGFALAMSAQFTHAVQIDADGQHDISALPALLAASARDPDAVIAGIPVFDASAPRLRRAGRWITHVLVWVETLSTQVRDSMCGLRVYPLVRVAALNAAGERIGERMDFDTEILVRLIWRGARLVQIPVAVSYPPGNLSNFDLWHDNARMAAMHLRLLVGMVRRLPALLRRRPSR